jgi:5-carboxymethyl-2-hydroxymuconate isomerase
MPHCIIEHSKNIENVMPVIELVRVVHSSVLMSGLFEEAVIKTRAIEFTYY